MISVLDPKLSWLASNAAVELDLLINGGTVKLDAVKQLATHLRGTLHTPNSDSATRNLSVDTETELILGRAFAESGDDPATILSKLMARTDEISEELSIAKEGFEQLSLETLRSFCLALSQSAAAYRQSVVDVRPPHPYRR